MIYHSINLRFRLQKIYLQTQFNFHPFCPNRYTEAVNYSVLVEKFPWYTQEGASYILGKCLRRFEGREGLPLWQKASEVLKNFYLGKTLTDFQKDKRWNLASAYEEAMKKYNPDPKPRGRRSLQPSPLPKIPNAQCAQFGI